jgi:hypothetical protein
VVEGLVGAELGDAIVYGEPGDLIYKPRGQWHTFWNARDKSARILEIISPAGFERYFERLEGLLSGAGPPDPSRIGALAADYGVEIDFASVPRLIEEHGVTLGPPPP